MFLMVLVQKDKFRKPMLYPSELQPRFDNSLILYCFGGRREIFRTFKNMHCSRNVVVSGQDTTGNPLDYGCVYRDLAMASRINLPPHRVLQFMALPGPDKH
jgi:hypothetical protein